MAPNPLTMAQTAGHAVADAAADVGGAIDKGFARTREEVEDVFAEARQAEDTPAARDAALYTGLAATVALGAIELPVAAAVGAAYALARLRR